MRVRMLVSMAGPAVSLRPGDVCDLSPEEATKWIAGGLCVGVVEDPVEPDQVIEPEPVVVTRPRGRRKAV